MNENTWKNFVVMLCRLGSVNTSREIADVIAQQSGVEVSSRQVAAVRANYTMGKY